MNTTPFDPWAKYAAHPLINDRRDLPRMRRDWMGDRVCIRYRKQRGNYRQHTQIGYAWGVLAPATRADQVAVTKSDGTHFDIHYGRVLHAWNLSKRQVA